jgi:hypothetical protein
MVVLPAYIQSNDQANERINKQPTDQVENQRAKTPKTMGSCAHNLQLIVASSLQLTTEVQMVPKLIGQESRIEGIYFEKWADAVRESKARQRYLSPSCCAHLDLHICCGS